MKWYCIYNRETGGIEKNLLQKNAPDVPSGQGFIEGNFPDNKYRIENGVPVEIPDKNAGVGEMPQDFAVRIERAKRLNASDWTQLPDANVDVLAWQAYRQALRDVPQQPGFPDNVEWPVPPA